MNKTQRTGRNGKPFNETYTPNIKRKGPQPRQAIRCLLRSFEPLEQSNNDRPYLNIPTETDHS